MDKERENREQRDGKEIIITPLTPERKKAPLVEPQLKSNKTPVEETVKKVQLDLDTVESKENLSTTANWHPVSLFEVKPSVRYLYQIIQRSTGALGGNGYDGAIYGELTMGSMQKVMLLLQR